LKKETKGLEEEKEKKKKKRIIKTKRTYPPA